MERQRALEFIGCAAPPPIKQPLPMPKVLLCQALGLAIRPRLQPTNDCISASGPSLTGHPLLGRCCPEDTQHVRPGVWLPVPSDISSAISYDSRQTLPTPWLTHAQGLPNDYEGGKPAYETGVPPRLRPAALLVDLFSQLLNTRRIRFVLDGYNASTPSHGHMYAQPDAPLFHQSHIPRAGCMQHFLAHKRGAVAMASAAHSALSLVSSLPA
jgi:hypothetical protein